VKILVDTREQAALNFNHPYVEGTERTALLVGDYAARFKDGHIPAIFFERKSLPDLFCSLGRDYKRFRREIMRSKENNIDLIIIIEGTIRDILKGNEYSQIEGIKILRTLLSVSIRYGIGYQFCRDRTEMSIHIVEYYCAYARKRMRDANVQT
jgi:ERCC4-type nuclease